MQVSAENTTEKIAHKLRKQVWKAQETFSLIEPGDKVMVCLSGGKDSYTLLDMLLHMQKAMKNSFQLLAVNLDQQQPGFPKQVLPEYLSSLGVPYRIVEQDTYSVVTEKIPPGKNMCSLCSRLRRGVLYDVATDEGATKIALGHHMHDVLETFFLNLFFSGKIETMPAKYLTDDKRHVVIRPLAYCREDMIQVYAEAQNFPIIPCNLCGSQENMQRKIIKQMIQDWEKKHPDRSEVMFTALGNIHSSHMYDTSLYDFSRFMPAVVE